MTHSKVKRHARYAAPLIAVLMLAAIPSIKAGWLQDDIPVCTDPAYQQDPVIVADGAGGSFAAWEDNRSVEIYVQKLNSEGTPLWTMNGIEATHTSWSAINPAVIPDGAGGGFLSFERDSSTGTFDCPLGDSRLFLERLDASGSILWRTRLTTTTGRGSEINLRILPDGAGGVILVWRTGTLYWEPYGCYWWANYHLFAQRIDASGNRLWGSAPVAVCLDNNGQDQLSVIREKSGDIVVAWVDSRNATLDIYAQKMDLAGNRLWGDNGAAVVTYSASQSTPRVASDGAGGAFVAWLDARVNTHVYAQRLDGSGSALWAPDGVPVCAIAGTKNEIRITEGPSRSAIVSWVMPVGGVSTLLAQRVDSAGTPLWDANGKQFSDARNPCRNALAIPDGEGGTVFAWERVVPVPPNSIICSMWGFSSTDIFAVGDNGLILHYDGTRWTMMSSPTTEHLHGVWGTAHDNMYAVGTNCTIIHYDGTAWRLETYPVSSSQLYGVWGSGPSDVWAVGTIQQMYHWNGSSWQRSAFGTTADYYGVYGTSSSNVYAVGSSVVHYDGTAWTQISISGAGLVHCVWVSTDNHVFLGGSNKLIHNDGTGWKTITFGSIGMGFSLWGTHAGNVYGVYEGGYLAHWNGAGAAAYQNSTNNLYGVWGTYGSDIWICGKAHTIRHFDGTKWITQNQLSSDIFMSKVDSAGNVLWNQYGAPAVVSSDDQTNLYLDSDAAGNALFAWRDGRLGNWDIFARKVSISRGPIVATELMSFNAGPFDDGVKVAWQLSQYTEGAPFTVSRADGGQDADWRVITPGIARDRLSFSFVDGAVEAGLSYRYRVQVSDERGSRVLFETDAIILPPLPLTLHQNFPNPFNPSTTIRYYVPGKCRVRLEVYDVTGRLVARLVDRDQPAGHYGIEWNGGDNLGKKAASGIYFCRLQAGKDVRSRKMVLLR